MDTINDKVEELVSAIQESTEYQNFQEAEREVRKVPGLAEKIREFCWKNYELQNSDADDLYERLEEFSAQYKDFRRNPVVERYLEHELRMCRILQEIHARLAGSVDLMI
ncbi:MAG: YlbF family regulator [Lachnospiraceae bacterium]|nr:YlbF family regulator [Lachnospiraceae bacterium]MCI9601422.1 YlbF family regulator [Lachnospiraceae bacterium]